MRNIETLSQTGVGGGELSILGRCAPSVSGGEYLNELITIFVFNEAVVP